MTTQNCVLQQLNTYQSNILTLFEGVVKERNDYKQGNDFLAENIKQAYDKVEKLERQNELLRNFNSSMKCIFSVGIVAFKKLDFSQVSCTEENLTYLELLKKIFIDLSIKITDPALHALSENAPGPSKKRAIGMIECDELLDKTKLRKVDFDDANVVTQMIQNFNVDGNFMEEVKTEAEDSSIEWASWAISKYLKSTSDMTQDDVKKSLLNEIDAVSTEETNNASSASVPESTEPRPGPSGFLGAASKNGQKLDGAKSQENDSPQKSAKEKFVKKSSHDVKISPRNKQSSSEQDSSSKSPVTPKRAKMLANFNIPKRSPRVLKSIFKEPGGSGKKLKQSVLNLKFLKEKSPRNESGNREEGNNKPIKTIKRDVQIICDSDSDSDDFIIESPVKLNKKSRSEVDVENRSLDETFINPSIIRKFSLKHNQVEKIFQSSTHRKRAKEKSPEYDSVPFIYKRETVRKKTERMKLPGHACVECNKYYQNALGDLNSSDLKKILNKCSRHRDKNPPALDDTPPGYWKPFLTCSTVCSPNKDDAR